MRLHAQSSRPCEVTRRITTPRRIAIYALIPTRHGRVQAAKPVDVVRLQQLLESYRKNHPYVPPPPPETPLLERTELMLTDFCKAQPNGDASERCYTALEYYDLQRKEAETACEVVIEDGRVQEQGCETQHRLEDFVRNMVGQAPMEHFVQTLLVLRRAQEEDFTRKAKGEASANPSEQEVINEQRERLTSLFYALDTDLNGKLDIGEFREGMQRAGQEMSGATVAQVLEAMGVQQGFLELEEFLAIAEVGENFARSALAQWMRVQSAKDRPLNRF